MVLSKVDIHRRVSSSPEPSPFYFAQNRLRREVLQLGDRKDWEVGVSAVVDGGALGVREGQWLATT